MEDETKKELTADEELDLLAGQMFSVRGGGPIHKTDAPKEESSGPKIVDKKEKSRQKEARRKAKRG
jgi:hypothetical protein